MPQADTLVTTSFAPAAAATALAPVPAAATALAPVPNAAATAPTTAPPPSRSQGLAPTATPTVVKILPGVYHVQSGDTLLGIAYRAGLTLDEVLVANPKISNPNLLALAQAVIIPEGGKAPVAAAPQIVTPVAVEINGGRIVYPQLGSPGGYVPLGAMSVSGVHTVGRKYYSAGSFEYLHGLFRVPFPLPVIQQNIVSLPRRCPPARVRSPGCRWPTVISCAAGR